MTAKYFVNGGVDNNWGTLSNWSLTSGGTGGQAVPTGADDVFFDSFSPNCNVNASSRAALTINFTGYTNTITMAQGINVTGSMTFSGGMTITGTGQFLSFGSTATHTSNGALIPNLFLGGTFTHTLADVFNVVNYSLSSGTAATIVNGNSISISGNFLMGNTTSVVSGTTVYTMTGTGTLTWPSTTGILRNSFTINSSGTITVVAASGNMKYGGGTFTYIAGTINVSAFTLLIDAAGATLAVGGIAWNNVTFTGSATHTLTQDITLTGLLTLGTAGTPTLVNGSAINCYGGVTSTVTTGRCQGTTIIKVLGTQTLSTLSVTTSDGIDMPFVFDAGEGTISISDKFRFNLGKVSFLSGAVVPASGSAWATGGSGSAESSRTFVG